MRRIVGEAQFEIVKRDDHFRKLCFNQTLDVELSCQQFGEHLAGRDSELQASIFLAFADAVAKFDGCGWPSQTDAIARHLSEEDSKKVRETFEVLCLSLADYDQERKSKSVTKELLDKEVRHPDFI